MEKVESIYEFLVKENFESVFSGVLRDINIIDFAILSSDVIYKSNVYSRMRDKYLYDLERIGYNKACEILSSYYPNKNLSEESIIRNSLSLLRRWIIRCCGYMCVRKLAEENVVDGIDLYMKRYILGEEVSDLNTLNDKLDNIDEDILSNLRSSV